MIYPLIRAFIVTWLLATPGFAQISIGSHAHLLKERSADYLRNEREHFMDVHHYDLTLNVDPDNHIISGVTKITGFVSGGGIDEVVFDLSSELLVDSVKVGSSTVSFSHDSNQLLIPLEVNGGEVIDPIEVYYAGDPGAGWHWGNIIYTLNFHDLAHTWFPCQDAPDDKAMFDLACTVPAGLYVASNGRLADIVAHGDGTETYYWHEPYQIATYLIVVHIGHYDVVTTPYTNGDTTLDLVYYAPPNQIDQAVVDYVRVPDMLDVFTNRFGPYPFPEDKVGYVTAPISYAGMEHQTCITLNSAYVTGQGVIDGLVAHELSHMWFGDCLTPNEWPEIWLNEGFASYAEAIYFEDMGLIPLEEYVDTYTERYFEGPLYDPPGFLVLGVYDKGAWVLHMLRHVMGDEAFFQTLQEYYTMFQYSNVSTSDFQFVAEMNYADDLSWFFNQWVYGQGHPQYLIEYTILEADGANRCEFRIRQTQTDYDFFQMPVDVRLSTDEGQNYDQTCWSQTPDQVFAFESFTGNFNEITIDPGNWLLHSNFQTGSAAKFALNQLDITEDDNDGAPEPGENVTLAIGLFNHLSEVSQAAATLSCNSDLITFTEPYTEWPLIPTGSAQPSATPFEFEVDPAHPDEVVEFTLDFLIEGTWQTQMSFDLMIGQADYLVVDDDGGADYEQYVMAAFADLNLLAEHWDAARRGVPNSNRVAEYTTMMWFTGDENEETLNQGDQAKLISFLNNGGRLFLTGQDIDEDLVTNGHGAEFFQTFLHADVANDSYPTTGIVLGHPDHPDFVGSVIKISGLNGANNQTSPGSLIPLGSAVPVLNYAGSSEIAAIQYEGSYRVMFFGFGFEAINSSTASMLRPEVVLERVITWLETGLSVEEPDQNLAVNSPVLYQNTPNPFQPSTMIRFSLPEHMSVQLNVYNTTGQLVKSLVRGDFTPGVHELSWDGTNEAGHNVGSGTYFYRLVTEDGYDQTQAMTLLK